MISNRDQAQLQRILGTNGLQATLHGLRDAARTLAAIQRGLKNPLDAEAWDTCAQRISLAIKEP